ncbi:hypothetical protein D3C83_223090 [compost metagenome]
MGSLADRQSWVSERLGARAWRAPGDLGGLADQPPEPLDKSPGSLNAALGPFDVAVGR